MSQRAGEKGNDEQDQEEEEKDLRNSCRARSQSTKSKDGRHDRDHEKNCCPVKHKAPRLKKVPRRNGGALGVKQLSHRSPAPNTTSALYALRFVGNIGMSMQATVGSHPARRVRRSLMRFHVARVFN